MSGRLKIILIALVLMTVLGMVYMEIKGRDSLNLMQTPWSYKIKKVKPNLPTITPTANVESTATDPAEILKQEQERYLESVGEVRRKEIEQNREEEVRRDKELAEQRAAEFAKLRQTPK